MGSYYDNIRWEGDKTVAGNYGPSWKPLPPEQQHQTGLSTTREAELAPGLVNHDSGRIREIEAAIALAHG